MRSSLRTKSLSRTRVTTATRWIGVAVVCALAGVLALLSSDRSRRTAEPGERHVVGAYRPDGARRPHEAPRPRAGERAADALSPQLEERLRAAAHVTTAPAPPSGAPTPLTPTAPLPPAVEAERQRALSGWQAQAQKLLDECVARPAAVRGPVVLDVFFAPASAPALASASTSAAAPRLSPALVSVPQHELRRLWRDTDPDELQGCLDRVRTLALSARDASKATGQVWPASREAVLVQL